MKTNYLVANYVVEGEDRPYFNRCGVAFPKKNGEGFVVKLFAVPASRSGAVTVILTPPKPKDETETGVADFGEEA